MTHRAGYHALCVAMVILDLVARSWRIGIVLRALGSPIALSASFTLTVFGDAVAALTPWRIGGEPARVFGAAQAGAPPATSVVGLAIESLVTYAVLALIGCRRTSCSARAAFSPMVRRACGVFDRETSRSCPCCRP